MANGLRMALLILVACFCMALPGFFHSQVDAAAQRAAPLAVGEMAPDFSLNDQNGRKVSLSESRDKNPVVLVFYRGYW